MSRTVVVKVGGNIFKGEVLKAVCSDVAHAVSSGDRVAMVHGGGPQASALQERLGQTPNIVAGRRITDGDALSVMKMVVAGLLNSDLCSALLAAGAQPIGLNGSSSRVIAGSRRPPRIVAGGGPDPIDFGFVADIDGINVNLLELLLEGGYTPVLGCLAADAQGSLLNINADVVANRLAAELKASNLVLVTGAPGVLRDIRDPGSRIPTLSLSEARDAISSGMVADGMIPKLDESIKNIEAGNIGTVHIVGSLQAKDLLRELESPGTVGTALRP